MLRRLFPLALAALSACPASVTLTSLALSPSSPTLAIGASEALTLTATRSDGSTTTLAEASWATSNTAVATVTGGVVLAVSAGEAIITATASGVSATARVTVRAAPAVTSIAASPASVTLELGAEQQLTVVGARDDGSTSAIVDAIFLSSNKGVVTVSPGGVLHAVGAGRTTVVVTAQGFSASVDVEVRATALRSVAIAPMTLVLAIGRTQQLTVTATDVLGVTHVAAAVWALGDRTVVSVSAAGVLTALAMGTTEVVATVLEGGVTKTASLAVTVSGPASQMDLPVTFDSLLVGYGLTGFAGAEASSVTDDPAGGPNQVAQVVRAATAATFAGTTLSADGTLGFAHAVPLAAGTSTMTLRTFTSAPGTHVRLKLEDHADPTHSVETDALTTTPLAWETLTFDFAQHADGTAALNPAYRFDKLSVFFNYGVDGPTAGVTTSYFDDVAFAGQRASDGGVVVDGGVVDAGPPVVIFDDDYAPGVTFAPEPSGVNALSVVTSEHHAGVAALQVLVPGGTGFTAGRLVLTAPVDLSRFNALTFWVKASVPATLNVAGFGDQAPSTTVESLRQPVTTTWSRVVIPIPLPARLTSVRSLFSFSEGPEDGPYLLFFDDVQFEALPSVGAAVVGNIGWPAPLSLEVGASTRFATAPNAVTWGAPVLTNGGNLTNLGFRYFTLGSSPDGVVTIDPDGVLTATAVGNTTVSARFGAMVVPGVTLVTVTAPLVVPTTSAAAPTLPATQVISLFSSSYTNVAVDTWRTSWSACCNTLTDPFVIGAHAVKKYDMHHFVGVEFGVDPANTLVDASAMAFLHLDVWSPNATELQVRLVNHPGPMQTEATVIRTGAALPSGQWVSLELPLSSFTGLSATNQLGQLLLLVPPGTGAVVYVDNLYFHQ